MSNDQALSKYEVVPRNGRFRLDDPRVLAIPIGEADVPLLKRYVLPDFAPVLKVSPEAAWEERISARDDHGPAEREWSREMSRYRPSAYVISEKQLWWKCVPEGEYLEDDFFLLGTLRKGSPIEEPLSRKGFTIARELAGLCDLLSGFREDYPPWGGLVSDWQSPDLVLNNEILDRDFGGTQFGEEWDPVFVLFVALNGDSLLVNQDGACGWWRDGADQVTPFAESLEECISRWVGHWFRVRARSLQNGTGYSPFEAEGLR